MASQGGTSRLAQMQMRFQQKQQQEKEQRKMEMTGSKLTVDLSGTTNITSPTGSSSSTSSSTNKVLSSSFGAGKVRQMFDERRRGAGIDRSYPLKPISTKIPTPGVVNSTTANKGTSKIVGGITTTLRKQPIATTTVRTNVKNRKSISTTIDARQRSTRNGSDLLNGNTVVLAKHNRLQHDNLDDETFPSDLLDGGDNNLSGKILSLGKLSSLSLDDSPHLNGDSNNNSLRSESSMKLKPVITKKTLQTNSQVRTVSAKSTGTVQVPSPSPSAKSNRRPTATSSPTFKSKSIASNQPLTPSASPSRPTSGPEGTVGCQFCGRFFNSDRIEKHETVCNKSLVKKRKTFDASLHRVKGTEAENYVKSKLKKSGPTKSSPAGKLIAGKKNNWRQKHEEFIAAIRAAKELKSYLAKGGKLSDLPPPPPSENPDYIQCPHCSRRFNEAAASRHIPKCKTMLHNKPKPGKPAPIKRK